MNKQLLVVLLLLRCMRRNQAWGFSAVWVSVAIPWLQGTTRTGALMHSKPLQPLRLQLAQTTA
jgi:hypothetical protein